MLTAKQLNDSFQDLKSELTAARAANDALDARLKVVEALASEKPVFVSGTAQATATKDQHQNVPGLTEVPVILAEDGYLDIDAVLGVENANAPAAFTNCWLTFRIDNQAVDTGVNYVGVSAPFDVPWYGQVTSMSRIAVKKGTHYVTAQLYADANWGGTCRTYNSRMRVTPTHY